MTWVRNHSSYLTVGGFWGGLQAAAAYMRGVIGNLIVLMPLLLLVGVPLGLGHPYLVDSPLLMSRYALLTCLILTIFYFGYEIGKIYVSGRTQVPNEFNGFFSRKWHWLRENFIGLMILLALVVVFVDLSPQVIEFVRKHFVLKVFGLKECAAAFLAIAGTTGGLIRYFPKTKPIQRKILTVLVGILSFVVTWGLILRIANYVYYGLPPHDDWQFRMPQICVALMFGTAIVSIWNAKALGKGCRFWLLILISIVSAAMILPCLYLTSWMKQSTADSSQGLGTITRPLARVATGLTEFDKIGITKKKDDLATASPYSLITTLIERKIALDLEAPKDGAGDENEDEKDESPEVQQNELNWIESLWAEASQKIEFSLEYYARAGLFLEQFETISDSKPSEIDSLRRKLTLSALDSFASKANLKSTKSSDYFQRTVLRRVLATFDEYGVAGIDVPEVEMMTNDEFVSWLGTAVEFEANQVNQLSSMRIPMSMAASYIRFLPDNTIDGAEFQEKSAPDFALSGPPIFSKEMLSDQSLKNELSLALLRRVLVVSNFSKGDSILDKLNDEWFESRNASKKNYECFASLKEASFIQIVEAVLNDEADINAEGIKRYVLENSDSVVLTENFNLTSANKSASRMKLIETALDTKNTNRHLALYVLGELYKPSVPFENELDGATPKENELRAKRIYRRQPGLSFDQREIVEIMAAQFIFDDKQTQANAECLIRRMAHGQFGSLDGLQNIGHGLFKYSVCGRLWLLGVLFVSLLLFCVLFVDPNSTSVHGFYRDRLATAFITTAGNDQVIPERRVLLSHLCNYGDGKSSAPYHLINAAINMQSSGVKNLRDRNADFFFFSRLFTGGKQTGFIRTSALEYVSPKLDASSAMAISAGAASPNMGKFTVPLATFLLTMLNVRLGYWIPNPEKLQSSLDSIDENGKNIFTRSFNEVFSAELAEVRQRRINAKDTKRSELLEESPKDQPVRIVYPSTRFKLLGLAFSGGGIRSAAVNLGCLQILNQVGVFKNIDYLSTVSGGGYLGTSISTFMRTNSAMAAEVETVERKNMVEQMLGVARFRWMPRFFLLYNEMFSLLDATSQFINVSDGGHIENLGVYELLLRRCEVIIIGEGEADPDGKFEGLSTLMRLAEIDHNIRIEFSDGSLERMFGKPKRLRSILNDATSDSIGTANNDPEKSHYTVGKIHYPAREGKEIETGYILYLRSTLTGKEDQIIKSYERANAAFPHEATVDQMFNEGQFEAYRRLGVKMMTEALAEIGKPIEGEIEYSYGNLKSSLETWWRNKE